VSDEREQERRTWENVPPEVHAEGRAYEVDRIGPPELNGGDNLAERRARRARRAKYETWRARIILLGCFLSVLLLLAGHSATGVFVFLLTLVAALDLRRRGRR
jgi:hypothetical protein